MTLRLGSAASRQLAGWFSVALLATAASCSSSDTSNGSSGPSPTSAAATTEAPAGEPPVTTTDAVPLPTDTTAAEPTETTPATEPTESTISSGPAELLTIDELLALGRPIVLAHTAGEDEFPASTLFGFGESVKAGVDMLDMNVQLTSDGVLVVHHDDTVDRATNGNGVVASMTFAQIAQLDDAYWFTADCVCTDQPAEAYLYRGIRTGDVPPPAGYTADDFAVPTFRDVVARFPNLPINIEIKGNGGPALAAAEVLAEEIQQLGIEDSVVMTSFDDEIVAAIQALLPDVEVSPGLGASTEFVLAGIALPAGQRILQFPPEFDGIVVITDDLIARSKAAGYVIWVWPNNRDLENLQSYRDFLDMGIEGLNINFPAAGVQAVTEYLAAR